MCVFVHVFVFLLTHSKRILGISSKNPAKKTFKDFNFE